MDTKGLLTVLMAFAALAVLVQGAEGSPLCSIKPSGAYVSQPNTTVWGQEIMIAFGSGFRYKMGAWPDRTWPWMAALITGMVMCGLAFRAYLQKPPNAPWLYIIIMAYSLATALVEFARVNFDASRFGFLTASWHNVPEYMIILHLLYKEDTAFKNLPWVLAIVWLLDVYIIFVGALDGVLSGIFWAGFPEQLTGICADWTLIFMFIWLYMSESLPPMKELYKWGMFGAMCHMLEIFPLILLLSGVTARPSYWISLVVAATSPLTFIFYNKFAMLWATTPEVEDKPEVPPSRRKQLLTLSIAIGLLTILGPALLIPECCTGQPTPSGMPEPNLFNGFKSRCNATTPKGSLMGHEEL